MVDVIRVPKVRTSCEYLPIDTNFVSILLLVSVLFSWTPYLLLISSANEPALGLSLVHTVKLKPIVKAQISGKLVTSCISDVATASVHSEKTSLKKMIIGRAKRAPHWGVQSRFRVIYYICQYVCRVRKCVGGITYVHAQSQFWAVKTDP